MTNERLTELLTALGSSADEVAASLARRGIRGDRHECASCPVARYLRRFAWCSHVEIGGTKTRRPYAMVSHRGSKAIARLPDAVRDFVLGFDDGRYAGLRASPELVAGGAS